MSCFQTSCPRFWTPTPLLIQRTGVHSVESHRFFSDNPLKPNVLLMIDAQLSTFYHLCKSHMITPLKLKMNEYIDDEIPLASACIGWQKEVCSHLWNGTLVDHQGNFPLHGSVGWWCLHSYSCEDPVHHFRWKHADRQDKNGRLWPF